MNKGGKIPRPRNNRRRTTNVTEPLHQIIRVMRCRRCSSSRSVIGLTRIRRKQRPFKDALSGSNQNLHGGKGRRGAESMLAMLRIGCRQPRAKVRCDDQVADLTGGGVDATELPWLRG